MKRINVATGIFEGYNDRQGIMLCGYEWGDNKSQEELNDEPVVVEPPADIGVIFSNKAPYYGAIADTWPYDRRIRHWFGLWGHELGREGTGGPFEKCLLQTNWCDSQAPNMDGQNYAEKLLHPSQVENFLHHVKSFQPRLILFLGSSMINFLNSPLVIAGFTRAVGPITEHLSFQQKEFSGRRFRVGFQGFESCQVVSLPHPSGSHGLSDTYIGLFANEIGARIQVVKREKNIQN